MYNTGSKWLSNSRLFIFVRIRKSLCKILINKRLKIAGSVLKVEKEEKCFMKYFFLDSCVLTRNLNETSKTFSFFPNTKFLYDSFSSISAHIYTPHKGLRIRGIYYLRLISYQVILN